MAQTSIHILKMGFTQTTQLGQTCAIERENGVPIRSAFRRRQRGDATIAEVKLLLP